MATFSTPEHMKLFGRPVWFGYSDPRELKEVARYKLIGGKLGPYNPWDENHVFAALSFRVSLDLCLENPRTLDLAKNAVNYHMRVVVHVRQDIGVWDTFTPSEPILSEAAISYLCEPKRAEISQDQGKVQSDHEHDKGRRANRESEESSKSENDSRSLKWSRSIKTLSTKLLRDGVIAKGTKGELYSRLMLILARDCVHLDMNRALNPTAPFTVRTFLMELYAKEHHRSICAVEPQILDASMNFTHFTFTEENIHFADAEDMFRLCHDLLRRSAALQLAPNQPTYDHLVPIYFGKANEVFKPSNCGVMLIQVKNKEKAADVSRIFRERFSYVESSTSAPQRPRVTHRTETPSAATKRNPGTPNLGKPLRETDYFCFGDIGHPILFLLLDLGLAPAQSRVRVLRSDNDASPRIWAIHSEGRMGNTFGCIGSIGCKDACKVFFQDAVPFTNDHDKLAHRNKIFSNVTARFRYPGYAGEGARGDSDTPMLDVESGGLQA
jgi:hypothetical protein